MPSLARLVSLLLTLVAVFAVGGASFVMGWPAAASAGWVVLVVVAGVWLENHHSASVPRPAATESCTFCGQSRAQVNFLVTTPLDEASICDGCAKLAIELMEGGTGGGAVARTPPSENPYAPPGD